MIDYAKLRARVLIGRPDGALARVRSEEDLIIIADKIAAAYERAKAPPPVQLHVMLIKHNMRWAEQLVRVEEISAVAITAAAEHAITLLNGANNGE